MTRRLLVLPTTVLLTTAVLLSWTHAMADGDEPVEKARRCVVDHAGTLPGSSWYVVTCLSQ